MVEVLSRNLLEERVSRELLASLEREASWSAEPLEEPKAKRQKLAAAAAGGGGEGGSVLSVEDRMTICCALKSIVHGQLPHPRLWGTLRSAGSNRHMDFILQVSLF